MSSVITDNNIDDKVDDEIYGCLNLDSPKSFFLFAGAGSGKTRSLVNVLKKFKVEYGKRFRLNREKVAIITYTNAASDEIIRRLEFDPIFSVSTIHSFAWEIIKHFNSDIREWVKKNLAVEIAELQDEQGKSRNLQNKTSQDRAKKIESKTKRLTSLDTILKFTYNPNGDNTTRDSLNHSEVISIAADFIHTMPLMQSIVVSRFPIILIDESQDTKKELINAFFHLQQQKKNVFTLGLFGDTMQRIYTDGKENLGQSLPMDWLTPVKKMNHRSGKRIIKLINDIRKGADGQEQQPRSDKEDGVVKLFIALRNADKQKTERTVAEKMKQITNDSLWIGDNDSDVKTLILEHHMAARRMGFLEFFEPLYRQDKLSTGLLDGSLSAVNLFTKIVLPIVEANRAKDKFAIARLVKAHSIFLRKEQILQSAQQIENVRKSKQMLDLLLTLWDNDKDPLVVDVLKNVYHSGLFSVPEVLQTIAARTDFAEATNEETMDGEEIADTLLAAWEQALSNPFSQINKYNEYLSEKSKFGTHQGVKGLEYPRVMVILDDEESRGNLFSYDKLFGSKELSVNDHKNIKEGKETGLDKVRRLFYVACSRAKESLAIVAYTDNPAVVKQNVISFGWFEESEIEILA